MKFSEAIEISKDKVTEKRATFLCEDSGTLYGCPIGMALHTITGAKDWAEPALDYEDFDYIKLFWDTFGVSMNREVTNPHTGSVSDLEMTVWDLFDTRGWSTNRIIVWLKGLGL